MEQKIYLWQDVKATICSAMSIRTEDFRDYHLVVGGHYKDIWHLWHDLVNSDIEFDGVREIDLDVLHHNLINPDSRIRQKYGNWVLDLALPIAKIRQELNQSNMLIRYNFN